MRVWLGEEKEIQPPTRPIYLEKREGRKKEIGYARKNPSESGDFLNYCFSDLEKGTERKIVNKLSRGLRRKKILETLLDHGCGITQKGIAEEVGVSDATIRKDLKQLEKEGLIERLKKSRVREIEEKSRAWTGGIDFGINFSPLLKGKFPGRFVKVPTKKGLELAEPELLGKEREYGVLEFGELSVEPWGSECFFI